MRWLGNKISERKMGSYYALFVPALVLLFVLTTIDPAVQLEREFRSVSNELLKGLDRMPATSDRRSTTSSRTTEARSEAFWLYRSFKKQDYAPVLWNAPVSVGDQIIVSSGPYKNRSLKVIAVRETFDIKTDLSSTTHIVSGDSSDPHFILTCYDPLQKNPGLINFLIDSNGQGVTALGTQHQTL